jgi:hypothetical protein
MSKKSKIISLFTVLLLAVVLAVGCGGTSAATPTPKPIEPTNQPVATEAAQPTDAAQQTDNSANDLATSVAIVQNPPTRVPSGKITPSPQVNLVRKFRFASLNGTVSDWQVVPGDGETCPTVTDRNVAIHMTFENTATKDYTLTSDLIKMLGPDDKPADSIYQGSVYMGKSGGETLLLVPAGQTVNTTFCTGISAKDDPLQLTLFIGDKSFERVRVPLAAAGTTNLGGYVTAKADKKFSFKGADFVLPQVIVTTGIWNDQSGQGQVAPGKVCLLLPTQVNNGANPNLFIEANDVTLDVGGQTLMPALNFNLMYQPAPYGLEKGKSANGALLFEIPQGTKDVTLHLKSSDGTYKDDVSVALTVPALP